MKTHNFIFLLILILSLSFTLVLAEEPTQQNDSDFRKPEFRIQFQDQDNLREDNLKSNLAHPVPFSSLNKFWYRPEFKYDLSLDQQLEVTFLKYDSRKSDRWDLFPERDYSFDMKREWMYQPEYMRKRYSRFYPDALMQPK